MNGHAVLRKQARLTACHGVGGGWRVEMPCTAVGTLSLGPAAPSVQEPRQGQCVMKVAPNSNRHQEESKGQ